MPRTQVSMPLRSLVGQITYGNAAALVVASSQYFGRSIISTVSDNFTISAWINLTAISGTQAIFQNGESDGNGYIFRINSAGRLQLDVSFVASLTASTVLTPGTPYHAVCRRISGTWQIFLNGSTDGGTIGNNPNGPGGNTTVGAQRTSGGTASNFFGGLLDDVRFYSRALSNGEITALYNQGTTPSIVVDSTSLEGHYKFDETSGNAADSSGNGRTLTNNNTATYTTGIVAISNIPARTAVTSPARTVAGARTLAA